jgi:hypothetical protein
LPVPNPEPESTLLNVSEILNRTSSTTKKRRSTSTFESSKKGRVSLSRSGRVVKPPLANWAGQRIVYDLDGNPVEVHDIKTKTIFTEDAPKDEIVSKVEEIQERDFILRSKKSNFFLQKQIQFLSSPNKNF